MNSYNNFQPQKQKKKSGGSGAAIAIVTAMLILAIISLSCVLIYTKIVEGYETKIAEYEVILEQYEGYGETLDNLNDQILKLSSSDNTDTGDVQGIASNEILSQLQNQQQTNSGFDVAEIASKVAPTVIGIKVDIPAQNINSFWQTSPVQESGSGIIISEDGYIVTNYHVVESAVEYRNAVITVVFIDGEEHVARYIGGDEINDLAVVKIEADNLEYAVLGSSGESKVGDYVIAIGNPLGLINLYGSVTFGIISGVNRKIEAENVAEELIQTDAAINPGNSGGALINSKGEVIGINTVKLASTEYEGLGFAIPMDYAKPLINSLIEYGYIKGRPTLAINGSEISRTVASFYRVPQGILVSGVDPESYAAGIIEANDIITQIDGKDVYSLTDMNEIVKAHAVDEALAVVIWRNGNYIEVSVKLSEKK